jgi:hypothetical protein
VLDHDVVGRQQPGDVGQRLAWEDDRPIAVELRRQRASSRIPERIWTDVRVDTARETTPRAWTRSSFEAVILKPAPTTVSVSII